jgi:hypothetical protein
MASESSLPATNPTSFTVQITEKLTKTNYRLWRVQILPAVRATQLEDILTGIQRMPGLPAKTVAVKTDDTTTAMPNSEYVKWMTRDQALLSYLLSSGRHHP